MTGASVDHEYIVCYGNSIRGAARNQSQYSNPDSDPLGDWASANMVGIATSDRRPNLHYDLVDPETELNYGCPDMGWRYDRNTMGRLIAEKRILWPSSPEGRPRRKAFLAELDSNFTGFSTIVGADVFTRDGTADIDGLLEARIFSFPKPVRLISSLVEQGAEDEDIVLDFFAGSGTTGHAVMSCNAVDGNNRRYILVQLPEPLDPENRDQKTAANFCDELGKPRTIAELTKERLLRAGKKIKVEVAESSRQLSLTQPSPSGMEIDVGFRVFKLDNSNIRAWNPDGDNLEQTLLDHEEHVLPGRTEIDIMYELLLKLGLDLCIPIESRSMVGKAVSSIGGGMLITCLAERITTTEVEALAQGIVAWHKELQFVGDTTCVFRDSAFENDIAKSNLAAFVEQYGIHNVRSL